VQQAAEQDEAKTTTSNTEWQHVS